MSLTSFRRYFPSLRNGVGTISSMWGILLLIVTVLAKGMGTIFLQIKYLLVSPLVKAPNSVAFNAILLKFSAVEFSTLMETITGGVSGEEEFFEQEINNIKKAIKMVDDLIFICFNLMTKIQLYVAFMIKINLHSCVFFVSILKILSRSVEY